MEDFEPIGPTSDHVEIRVWAQIHSARPAQVMRQVQDGEPAILQFVFGEVNQAELGAISLISWESFFALFDVLELVLVGTGRPGRTHYELLRREPKPSTLGVVDAEALH